MATSFSPKTTSSSSPKAKMVLDNSSPCTFSVIGLCKTMLMIAGVFYLVATINSAYLRPYIFVSDDQETENSPELVYNSTVSPTNLSHLVFGLIGSEKAVHWRRKYLESWWRPGKTRGYLYLDKAPTGDLLPWRKALPPYRISQNLTELFREIKPRAPIMHRMNYGILEIMKEEILLAKKEEGKNLRWLVMGDDDSVFFIDNMVDILTKYDHNKYYYFGGQSEFILSNYWYSFNQGFGGAGFILSFPLAKALAEGMEDCLRRSAHLTSADHITMTCIADYGVNFTPLKGIHQIDLHGDISGLLSSHPKAPLLSLHHMGAIEPIFPDIDRFESVRRLMKAAKLDHTRLLQQTICHHKQKNWTISTSWGYSVNIYEKIMPRWLLQLPIETFKPWVGTPNRDPPHYMFNTRKPNNDPCESPHVFFFDSIRRISKDVIRTTYYRSANRGLSPCLVDGNHTADEVLKIVVYSPATKRHEDDRCECCDVEYGKDENELRVQYRECLVNEIIA